MCLKKRDHIAVVTEAKQQKQSLTKWKELEIQAHSIQHCEQITFINETLNADTNEKSNNFFFRLRFFKYNLITRIMSRREQMTENKNDYKKI